MALIVLSAPKASGTEKPEKIAIFGRVEGGVTFRRYKSFLRLERFYTLCLANNLFRSENGSNWTRFKVFFSGSFVTWETTDLGSLIGNFACGNSTDWKFNNFLPLLFYVKSILADFKNCCLNNFGGFEFRFFEKFHTY